MVTALTHGVLGLAVFVGVLLLAHRRFRGGEQGAPSTDLGLD
jgi:hypothetical protein